jgi:hypothetical protein
MNNNEQFALNKDKIKFGKLNVPAAIGSAQVIFSKVASCFGVYVACVASTMAGRRSKDVILRMRKKTNV